MHHFTSSNSWASSSISVRFLFLFIYFYKYNTISLFNMFSCYKWVIRWYSSLYSSLGSHRQRKAACPEQRDELTELFHVYHGTHISIHRVVFHNFDEPSSCLRWSSAQTSSAFTQSPRLPPPAVAHPSHQRFTHEGGDSHAVFINAWTTGTPGILAEWTNRNSHHLG